MPPRGPMKAPAKPKNAKGTLIRLMAQLKPHRLKLIIVGICIAVSSACGTFGTYLLKDAINLYIQPLGQQFAASGVMPDLSGFFRFLVMMIGIYLLGAFSSFLCAAKDQRGNTNAFPDIQRADALRSVEFMS